jgi:hypothetical protein
LLPTQRLRVQSLRMTTLVHRLEGGGQAWWTARKSGSPSTPYLPLERHRGRHTGRSPARDDRAGAGCAPWLCHSQSKPFVISHTGPHLSSFYTRFRHITHGATDSSFHTQSQTLRHFTHKSTSFHTPSFVILHTTFRHFTHTQRRNKRNYRLFSASFRPARFRNTLKLESNNNNTQPETSFRRNNQSKRIGQRESEEESAPKSAQNIRNRPLDRCSFVDIPQTLHIF